MVSVFTRKAKEMLNENDILTAIELLQAGEVIGFPTETVYGLAADASNPEAVKKIFALKNRPIDHPLIVHIASDRYLKNWAIDIPERAYQLTRAFWPGPLTLILKKAPFVSPIITGDQETIGLRCPSHPVAQAVLRAFRGGVAAPSANQFGYTSSTSADHVRQDFGDKIPLVLEGGVCQVGIESTIVDLTSDSPTILRPGMITQAQLEAVLQCSVLIGSKHSPRVSGSLTSHYAPKTPTKIMAWQDLLAYCQKLLSSDRTVVIARKKSPFHLSQITWKELPDNAERYAQLLYHTLRESDQLGVREILIEQVPSEDDWAAVYDRLKRATTRPNRG